MASLKYRDHEYLAMGSDKVLEVKNVSSGYTGSPVIKSLSIQVYEGTVTSILGRNGMGKTTTLRTIMGIIEPTKGTVYFENEDITNLPPYELYEKGLGFVTEDRDIFPKLTVLENLHVPIIKGNSEWGIDEIFKLFPRLEERKNALGMNLSGGEQQMLAIARALRPEPKLLLLDEPTEGLAPQIQQAVVHVINELTNGGMSILLVEQNVELALKLSDHVYILDSGNIVFDGPVHEALASRGDLTQYLGVELNANQRS